MMLARDQLTAALNQLLQPQLYTDYCPNGLQVQGKSTIRKIITGVTASAALFDAAIAAHADAILVHHGIFWKGDTQAIVGLKHQRIATLINHDINLYAYHLPLDCHLTLGNNRQLAQLLEITITQHLTVDQIPNILWLGELTHPQDAATLGSLLEQRLQRQPLIIAPPQPHPLKTIAWCTGAAQKYLELAKAYGADAYISGEISENTYHTAQELDIYYFAAGHHATERYGVQAVGQYLAETVALQHQFIDIANPV